MVADRDSSGAGDSVDWELRGVHPSDCTSAAHDLAHLLAHAHRFAATRLPDPQIDLYTYRGAHEHTTIHPNERANTHTHGRSDSTTS